MARTAFPFGSAQALVRLLERRELSSLELLKAYLERVDRLDPALGAVVVQDRERAFSQARAADRAIARGTSLGPLHGLPVTVKEGFDLAGHPTTFGRPELAANFAREDAVVVQRLKAAGAVVFGKSNMALDGADVQTRNPLYGTTRNPWDLTRTAGGSSGGSAVVVAAGLAALEFGSDIGGSIRGPAAFCGVYGHKPTWGVVPLRGHQLLRVPVAETDLVTVGPLARSADDLALALRVCAGPDLLVARGWSVRFPPPPRTLAGLRVAVWLDDAQAPVDDAVREPIEAAALALQAAGAQVDFGARPDFVASKAHEVYMALLVAQMAAWRPDHGDLVAARQRLDAGDFSARATFLRRATASFKDVFDAQQRRERLRWAWHRFFERFDVLLAPATCTAAFEHDASEPLHARRLQVRGQPQDYFAGLFWAGLATCARLPATAAPIGQTGGGLPVGLQIIGPEMGDLTTIWVARQLARLRGGFRPPPMAGA